MIAPLARTVLVAEDDPDIAALVARYLRKAGYRADVVHSGSEVLPRVRTAIPDALVLDLMLPGVDGLAICRALRDDAATAAIPIIIVTARGEEADRIIGLELGADDYLTKPFSPNELVARVRAVLRRTQPAPAPSASAGTKRYGPIEIDHDRHIVSDGAAPVRLTAKEFLLLDYLLQHRGRVLSRDVLLSDVWGYRYTGGTRTVDVHVRRLREKLPYLEHALETVKQFGYRLADPPPEPARGR
jgi:DNA-binding response OmpR family regulator